MKPANCPQCGAPVGKGAYKCRCGWVAANPAAERPMVPCCFDGCVRGALCRVHTATGWANVCEFHFPQIQSTPYVAASPVIDEVLKAYRSSKAYAAKQSGNVGDFLREPGSDDEKIAA